MCVVCMMHIFVSSDFEMDDHNSDDSDSEMDDSDCDDDKWISKTMALMRSVQNNLFYTALVASNYYLTLKMRLEFQDRVDMVGRWKL